MREQTAQHPPFKRRASADQYTVRQGIGPPVTDDADLPDAYFEEPRLPTSTRRYYDTRGNPIQFN